MLEESVFCSRAIRATGSTKNERRNTPAQRLRLGVGLNCIDFLAEYKMLAIGSTKAVHIVEVVQQSNTAQSNSSVLLAMRMRGTLSNLAKVGHIAWCPSKGEAVLAFVQMGCNITVLFDVLLKKGESYTVQQWSYPSRNRVLRSSIDTGEEFLSNPTLAAVSTSLVTTLDGKQHGECNTTQFLERDATRQGNMVELFINTKHLEVEQIAWDLHKPYSFAFTSHLTHFELWAINVTGKKVYSPVRTLRPRAHNECTKTHGVAFSPFNPNFILVAVEGAKIGKVLVYDRREVWIMHSVETTGPCFSVNFHPRFADLFAVCYQKTSGNESRVEFFNFASGASCVLSERMDDVMKSHCQKPINHTKLHIIKQEQLPPIDCVDSISRFYWRPCNSSINILEDTSIDVGITEIDTVSSHLWFATMTSNGHEISVRDAANGFSPIFVIKSSDIERETAKEESSERLTLRKINDCVWVNELTIVYVFNDTDVVITSFLEKHDTCNEMAVCFATCDGYYRMPYFAKTNAFSLGAVLPTSAVVSGAYGLSFWVRNTFLPLRDYYTKVINFERAVLLEQLGMEEEEEGGGSSSNDVINTGSIFNAVVSTVARSAPQQTPCLSAPSKPARPFYLHGSLRTQQLTTFTPPNQFVFDRSGVFPTPSTIIEASANKRPVLLFPFLSFLSRTSLPLSLLSPAMPVNSSAKIKSDKKVNIVDGVATSVSSPQRVSALTSNVNKTQPGSVAKKGWRLTPHSADEKTLLSHSLNSSFLDSKELGALDASVSEERLSSLYLPQVEELGGETKLTSSVLFMSSKDENTAIMSRESIVDTPLVYDTETQAPPLGIRSFVTPKIEQFLLADDKCGWAYVERPSEKETFVHYALKWEMGYKVAHKIKFSCPTNTSNRTVIDENNVDRLFAKIMAHNAKVCKLHKRRMEKKQRENELMNKRQNEKYYTNSNGDTSVSVGVCMRINKNNKCGVCEDLLVGSVDPREEFWAAATKVWRSHSVSLITSFVCSQLNYCSLVGDVQYCIVMYFLFCLWWKLRHGSSLESKQCPILSHKDTFEVGENTARVGNIQSAWQWKLRATQWVEQYLASLSERKLYVPLNELMLIASEVMGNSISCLLRVEDRTQKLYTYVYCGICSKAELVALPLINKNKSLHLASCESALPQNANKDVNAHCDSDHSSSDICDTSSCCSSLCTCSECQSTDCEFFDYGDDYLTNEKGNNSNNGSGTLVLANNAAPRNAVCTRCSYSSHMTCVICGEVVEGMYLWLRSCCHGGHVHHIEEWLKFSSDCPCCGVPIPSLGETYSNR